MSDNPAADLRRAESLFDRATSVAPNAPLLHYTKGIFLRASGRCAEAIPEFEIALTANPNWAHAIAQIGRCKIYMGEFEAATPFVQKAIRLAPETGKAVWLFWMGQASLLQSRTDDAVSWFEKSRALNPQYGSVRRWLASAYGLRGQSQLAAVELAASEQRSSSFPIAQVAVQRRHSAQYFTARGRSLLENTYLAGLRAAGAPD